MAVLPTCTMTGPNGSTVVVNKEDKDSYLKRGYEFSEDNPVVGSPEASVAIDDFNKRKEAHQEAIAEAVAAESEAKAEADNSAAGGDTEASGIDEDFEDFDDE